MGAAWRQTKRVPCCATCRRTYFGAGMNKGGSCYASTHAAPLFLARTRTAGRDTRAVRQPIHQITMPLQKQAGTLEETCDSLVLLFHKAW